MNSLIPFSSCTIVFALLLGACAPAAVSPAPSSTVIPPTSTSVPTSSPEPTPTATTIPSPTPLPGTVAIPVEQLARSIPWLPMDPSAKLSVNLVAFNAVGLPFNNATVRQAFAHAIDRGPLIDLITKYDRQASLATTLTPPATLGRDLSGQVGVPFDPVRAKELLTEAGYADPSTFPKTVFLVSGYGGYPGARFNAATAMAKMWETHLGVQVDVQVIPTFREYYDRIDHNPPGIFWFGWAADYNDPDNFLRELYHSGSEPLGGFSNPDFDRLVERARASQDPAERQALYIQAERLLCEEEAALIPLYHS